MTHFRRYCMVLLAIFVLFPLNVDADRSGTKSVTLVDQGEESVVRTEAETVGELLASKEILNSVTRVFPRRSSSLSPGSHVFIYRSNSSRQSEKTPAEVSPPEIYQASSWALPLGKTLRIRGVKPQSLDNVRAFAYDAGEPGLELRGRADHKVDQLRQLRRQGTIALRATGYSPHALDTAPYDDGFSALGLPAGYGIVAVDPSVIPLGTHLYVEGYGYAIAADVGGDIKGKRIDLCFPDRRDALTFGTRWLQVHILG